MPWRRLTREWLLYVAIMAALFVAFFRDRPLIGLFAGLLVSGPLYLAIGYVLAKFGYQRKSYRQMRSESAHTADDEPPATSERAKPAPTKRTGGGGRPAPTGRKRKR